MDACEHCNALRHELYHNNSTGLALCEHCDLAQDALDAQEAIMDDPDLREAERQRKVIEAWMNPALIPILR